MLLEYQRFNSLCFFNEAKETYNSPRYQYYTLCSTYPTPHIINTSHKDSSKSFEAKIV